MRRVVGPPFSSVKVKYFEYVDAKFVIKLRRNVYYIAIFPHLYCCYSPSPFIINAVSFRKSLFHLLSPSILPRHIYKHLLDFL